MRRHLKKQRALLFTLRPWAIRLWFWSGAILVGLVSAALALVSAHADELFHTLAARYPWLPLLLTPLVVTLSAWLCSRFFPGSEGSGIPQTIAALRVNSSHPLRDQVLHWRIAFGKFLLTCLGLLGGASIGREGPTVHIGAAIMHSLGRFSRFPAHYIDKGMILAGASAGISAAFNTPLAGIIFAIEELGRSFEERSSGLIITAVVLAGITAVAIQGNYSYFGSTSAVMGSLDAWLWIPVVGAISGVLGGVFSLLLIHGNRRAVKYLRRWPVRAALCCGLAVALIGLASGGTAFGTGYSEAKAIITGTGESHLLYPLYKFLATLVSYFSGIPGGIFAPSLAIGAGIGDDLGMLILDVPASAMVVLGTVGYFAGVVQAPITAFVIVMEMTNDHALILPLMATAFIANAVSKLVCPTALYRGLAENFLLAQGDDPVATENRKAPRSEGPA